MAYSHGNATEENVGRIPLPVITFPHGDCGPPSVGCRGASTGCSSVTSKDVWVSLVKEIIGFFAVLIVKTEVMHILFDELFSMSIGDKELQ